jgi:phosphopantothenoylcysteine decarboxylase/phosphopantothenate--cysteine ligase
VGGLVHRKRRPARSPPLHIVVTAGPTREYLDSIRFLSNPSSGKMGYAIAAAAAAAARGHRVTLVSGPVDLAAPPGVRRVSVETAEQMLAAAKAAFASADVAIFAAAVCDYRPKHRATRKPAKKRGGLALALVPTVDVAAALGRRKAGRITIGFALEDRAGRRRAEAKLRSKRFDAILLNAPTNIGSDRASLDCLVAGDRWRRWTPAAKTNVAGRIIRLAEQLFAARPRATSR